MAAVVVLAEAEAVVGADMAVMAVMATVMVSSCRLRATTCSPETV